MGSALSVISGEKPAWALPLAALGCAGVEYRYWVMDVVSLNIASRIKLN